MGRWYRHKRWISFIFAFVVLLSGMCLGLEQADFHLCCARMGIEETRTLQRPPLTRSEHQTVEELSGTVIADMIQDDSRRTGKRCSVKADLIWAMSPSSVARYFYYQRMEEVTRQRLGQGSVMIVRYIQHQDGKKDSAMYV